MLKISPGFVCLVYLLQPSHPYRMFVSPYIFTYGSISYHNFVMLRRRLHTLTPSMPCTDLPHQVSLFIYPKDLPYISINWIFSYRKSFFFSLYHTSTHITIYAYYFPSFKKTVQFFSDDSVMSFQKKKN